MKKVRDEMGLTNVKIMVPFCRTVEEAHLVVHEMAHHGLEQRRQRPRGVRDVRNSEQRDPAPEFAEIFDGFSIGSNDLTQLTLGVDRDSEIVAHVFDERNDAVRTLIAQAIHHARRLGRKIGICGQAPSDYPEFAEFLVERGIDSISLNPDAVLRTMALVGNVEQQQAAVVHDAVPAGGQP